MQDQGVVGLPREELIKLIGYRKKEFEDVLSQYDALKREIDILEEKLCNMGESLNNPRACLNPIAFVQKKCEECGYFGRCSYEGKGEYGRFKLASS